MKRKWIAVLIVLICILSALLGILSVYFINSMFSEEDVGQQQVKSKKSKTSIDYSVYDDLSDDEVLEQVMLDVAYLTDQYNDDDGYILESDNQMEKALRKAYKFGSKLVSKDIINDCTYCEEGDTVAYFTEAGTYVYTPTVKGTMAGAGEDIFGEMSQSELSDTLLGDSFGKGSSEEDDGDSKKIVVAINPQTFVNRKENDAEGLAYEKLAGESWPTGVDTAASRINKGCPEYEIQDLSEEGDATLEKLKNLFSSFDSDDTAVIFYNAHGAIYEERDGTKMVALQTASRTTSESWDDGEIVSMGYSFYGIMSYFCCITTKFIDHYMSNVGKGFFFCSCCHSGAEEGGLKDVLFQKGFNALLAPINNASAVYFQRMGPALAKYLVEEDEEKDGATLTCDAAVIKAIDHLKPLEKYIAADRISFVCKDNPDKDEFRLRDKALTEDEKRKASSGKDSSKNPDPSPSKQPSPSPEPDPEPSETKNVSYEISDYYSHYKDVIDDWSLEETDGCDNLNIDKIYKNNGFQYGVTSGGNFLFANADSSPVTVHGMKIGDTYEEYKSALEKNGWSALDSGYTSPAVAPDGSTIRVNQYWYEGTVQSEHTYLLFTTDEDGNVLYWYMTNDDMMTQDNAVDYFIFGYQFDQENTVIIQ